VNASYDISIKNGIFDYTPIGQAYWDPRVGAAAAQADYNSRGYTVSDDATNNVTVADFFNAERGVRAWTPYRGNAIYIHAGRLNTSDASRNQAFHMHEILHNTWASMTLPVFKRSLVSRKIGEIEVTLLLGLETIVSQAMETGEPCESCFSSFSVKFLLCGSLGKKDRRPLPQWKSVCSPPLEIFWRMQSSVSSSEGRSGT